jgi:hypothetical protein
MLTVQGEQKVKNTLKSGGESEQNRGREKSKSLKTYIAKTPLFISYRSTESPQLSHILLPSALFIKSTMRNVNI